jgi:peptidase M23-like protein
VKATSSFVGIICLLGFIAGGCSSSPGEGDNCLTEQDCATGQVCFQDTCHIADCPQMDCPENWACIDGQCCNQTKCCSLEGEDHPGTCDNDLDDDCDGWTDEQDSECEAACTLDEDCTNPDRPFCISQTCVECRADAHCTDEAKPLCSQGTCRTSGCLNDEECTDDALPYCLESACVECRTDPECTEASLPYCLNQSCVECQTDAHCTNDDLPICEDNSCVTDTPPCGEGSKPTSFTWPCPNIRWICQAYGVPVDYQTCGFHTGTDICGTNGERIESIASGKVVHVGPMWLDGPDVGRGPYAIIIQHSPGFYSTYGHNRSANVSEGDCVTKGQKIAEMGDLGYSYGPHLHIEVLNNTSFTGDWATPFNNACSKYQDLESYVSP